MNLEESGGGAGGRDGHPKWERGEGVRRRGARGGRGRGGQVGERGRDSDDRRNRCWASQDEDGAAWAMCVNVQL